MKIKVIFPTKDKYIKKTRPAYYDWIFNGFKSLPGVNVIETDDMLKSSFNEPRQTITAIDIIIDNIKIRVWYDWSDFQRFVYPEVIKENDLYYKVECSQGHLDRFNIQPAGHGVTEYHKYVNNLNRLRELKNKREYTCDVLGVFRATSPKPGLRSIRIDCAEIVQRMNINHYVKVQPCNFRPVPSQEHSIVKKYNYVEFLERTAKSKLNLLMPGMGELTWRVSETFGMGACGIMPRITTILPGNPQNCWIEVKRDLSDLREKIEYYLSHDEEREQIAKNGLVYYEKYLTPTAQAKNILQGAIDVKRKIN
jgi:glycosyltransferase involved in cell wall biosynthesis